MEDDYDEDGYDDAYAENYETEYEEEGYGEAYAADADMP